jgi:hypothetical protein
MAFLPRCRFVRTCGPPREEFASLTLPGLSPCPDRAERAQQLRSECFVNGGRAEFLQQLRIVQRPSGRGRNRPCCLRGRCSVDAHSGPQVNEVRTVADMIMLRIYSRHPVWLAGLGTSDPASPTSPRHCVRAITVGLCRREAPAARAHPPLTTSIQRLSSRSRKGSAGPSSGRATSASLRRRSGPWVEAAFADRVYVAGAE